MNASAKVTGNKTARTLGAFFALAALEPTRRLGSSLPEQMAQIQKPEFSRLQIPAVLSANFIKCLSHLVE